MLDPRNVRRSLLLTILAAAGLGAIAGCGRPAARDAAPRDGVHQSPAAASTASSQHPSASDAAPRFSPEAYLAHVAYLASDELGGRGVGSLGIRQASEYISDHFQNLGLQPGGEDGTYFQTFEMKTGAELTDSGEFAVTGLDNRPVMHEDYVPFAFSSNDTFDGDVVFCGYGIVNAEKQHDDYVHMDVTGKVVLVLRGEPPQWEPQDGLFTENATFQNKVYGARERGAAALLIADQLPEPGEPDELEPFVSRPNTAEYGLPAFHVSRELADRLLAAGGLESLESLQKKIDGGEYSSAELTGVRIKGQAGIRWKTARVRNVIGILPGRGPESGEYVVIGAHHDHLGLTMAGEGYSRGRHDEAAQVHNGADDNASGVAGVLELASAFAQGERPDRTLVFMTFTAEESGLLGSQHFVSHPTFPLDKTVAMLNLDMIGRMPEGKDEVHVFGTKSADEMADRVAQAGERIGLSLKTSGGAIGGSDQTSFYVRQVPALHFFTGIHDDYHTPDDDTDKINEEGATRVLELVHGLAADLAAGDVRLTYSRAGGEGMQRTSGGFKVVMGIMPSYADSEEPGMEVVAVSHGKPAEKAGMHDGDRILAIDGKTVNNVYDYMAAVSGKKPGETVEVRVKRGDGELTLTVPLVSGR